MTALQLTSAELKTFFGDRQLVQLASGLTDVTQVYGPQLSDVLIKAKAEMLFDAWSVMRNACVAGTPCTLLAAAFRFQTAEDAQAWNDALEAQGNGLENPTPLPLTSARYWDDASPMQNVSGTKPATGNRPAMKAIYVGVHKGNVTLGMNLQGLDYDSAAARKAIDAIVSRWMETLKQEGLE
jgi:hypothetical protein